MVRLSAAFGDVRGSDPGESLSGRSFVSGAGRAVVAGSSDIREPVASGVIGTSLDPQDLARAAGVIGPYLHYVAGGDHAIRPDRSGTT